MRTIAVLLASLAYAGHGRVVKETKKSTLHNPVENHYRNQELRSNRRMGASSALSKLLLAFNPPAGWQLLKSGSSLGCIGSNRICSYAKSGPVFLMRIRSDFEENPLKPPPEAKEGESSGFDISKVSRNINRGLIRLLIDLRFAVVQFGILTVLSALGTFIEQGKETMFYEETYGSYSLFFNFLPDQYKVPLANALDAALPSPGGLAYLFGFDHMYSSPPYVFCGAALGASLAACSFVRQIPMAKSAQRWDYATTPKRFESLDGNHVHTPGTTAAHVQPRRAASALSKQGYHVFFGGREDGGAEGYAFKGLSGRFAPIGVHVSMILIILGAAYSGLGSWRGDQYVASGTSMAIEKALTPRGPLASGFRAKDQNIRVDDFRIEYRDDGSIDQFYADVALDKPGKETSPTKTIKVNVPYVKDGLTAYMSDWTIGSVRVLMRPVTTGLPQSWKEFVLPMSKLPSDDSILGTYVPFPSDVAAPNTVNGAFLVAKDLKQLVVFNTDGSFAGARTVDSQQPIRVGSLEILLSEIKGSAGLQMKVDPGVTWVYLGFAGTMATSFASFLSHNQVWLFQEGEELYLGGKTNRLKRELDDELDQVLAETKTVPTR
mmetsp:Transcript_7223/g.11772  ORF Transcript_7223/g.11772 Transcript_7223/m.11772 type:complete len:605 (+) Transcript_7223:81-1895(+)